MPKERIIKKFIKKYDKLEANVKNINPEKTQEYRDLVDNAKLETFNHLLENHKQIETMYYKGSKQIKGLYEKLKKQKEKTKYIDSLHQNLKSKYDILISDYKDKDQELIRLKNDQLSKVLI